MNHFISGIIKITILEASVALLFIDLVAGERFARVRSRAAAVLAGLMVLAWANYGALRPDSSVPYALSALLVVLAAWWLVRAGFSTEGGSPRMRAFRDQARRVHRRLGPKLVASALVAAVSVGWVVQGVRSGSTVMVHQWEQFHFYLGAKYQRELGYFNLYKAAILADRETVNVLAGLGRTRDLHTFEEVPVATALADADAVKARFAPQRWEAFKADWATMVRLFPMDWQRVMSDHGNSSSPAWAIIAAPLTTVVPLTREGEAYLGWLDMLLMLVLWLTVFHTFGPRAGQTGLVLWAMAPLVFDYLAGSFLRWDWLFATGMAACFIARKRYLTAGAFFGYAVATKLFPLFFGVAMLLRALWRYRATRTVERDHLRFLAGSVAGGGVAVVLAALLFGPDIWVEYAQRIAVAQAEKFYSIQYSLKTVFLQLAAGSWAVWQQGLFPSELMQARADVDISQYQLSFLVVRLAFTLAIAQLARRADDVEAFLLGPLLVFTWLTVNMYYWNMLGLLGLGLFLRRDRSPAVLALLVGLHVIFMFFYLYQHTNRGYSEGFAVAALLAVLVAAVGIWEGRLAASSAGAEPVPRPTAPLVT